MSNYTKITESVLAQNETLFQYLRGASIGKSRRGDGTFVGAGIAPEELVTYGIILPKGGMIIPEQDPSDLQEILKGLRILQQEQRLAKEVNEKAARKADDDIYLEGFKRLCNKYQMLEIELKELCHDDGTRFGALIEDCEGRHVFEIITAGTQRPDVADFEAALEKEVAIRDFRRRNILKVLLLQQKLVENHARGFAALNWRGRSSGSLEASEYGLSISHHIQAPREKVTWNEEGLQALERYAHEKLSETSLEVEESMKRLLRYDLSQSSVRAKGWSSGLDGSFPTRLVVNGEWIPFPTLDHAEEAEFWALERGAYLDYHFSLGDKWRDRARSEAWSYKKSFIVKRILDGAQITISTNSSEGTSNDGMRKVTYTSYNCMPFP